ncbi:MAG: hypothetical protein JWP06_11 [Candidatus Saccharibacteria bacterium]|nr:hypothetical protein [Candidatus Saccharibacteria bacterium]
MTFTYTESLFEARYPSDWFLYGVYLTCYLKLECISYPVRYRQSFGGSLFRGKCTFHERTSKEFELVAFFENKFLVRLE